MVILYSAFTRLPNGLLVDPTVAGISFVPPTPIVT